MQVASDDGRRRCDNYRRVSRFAMMVLEGLMKKKREGKRENEGRDEERGMGEWVGLRRSQRSLVEKRGVRGGLDFGEGQTAPLFWPWKKEMAGLPYRH